MNLDIRWMTKAAAFCNKIWQASRFFVQAHQRLQESGRLDDLKPCLQPTRPENRWIMSRCAVTVAECNDSLDKADFHVLTRALREFMYTNLCDVYLVCNVPRLIASRVWCNFHHRSRSNPSYLIQLIQTLRKPCQPCLMHSWLGWNCYTLSCHS